MYSKSEFKIEARAGKLENLIVRSLQERRRDYTERLQSTTRKTGRESNCVLLGHTNIEKSVPQFVF